MDARHHQLARQLGAELDAEYEMERATRAPTLNVQTGLVQGVIDISDDEIKDEVDLEESNDDVDSKEWSNDPKHGNLIETNRRLREQE